MILIIDDQPILTNLVAQLVHDLAWIQVLQKLARILYLLLELRRKLTRVQVLHLLLELRGQLAGVPLAGHVVELLREGQLVGELLEGLEVPVARVDQVRPGVLAARA